MSRRDACLVGLLGVAFLVGCSSGVQPEVIPPLESVSGKVTLDGQPAKGVSVTFFPAENNKGNASTSTTDDDGHYTLTYRNGEEGIAVGDYVVLFSKLTQPDGSPIPEGQTAADVGAVDQIPESYRLLDNPVNMVSVPKGGKTFDFDLKSK
jgi:hypothetical protein